MSLRRVGAMVRRLAQELHRDRRSMALLFVAPVVLTGLMAYVLRGQQVAPASFVVVNQAGPAGEVIVDALDGAVRAEGGATTNATDQAQAEAALRTGTAALAI